MKSENTREEEETQELDMDSASCARCGMEKPAWRGNQGRGAKDESDVYCCQGCADDTGCTCDSESEPSETLQRSERKPGRLNKTLPKTR